MRALYQPARVQKLIETGQTREARLQLEHHLHTHPEDAEAWLLLAQVLPTPRQQVWCLDQVLRLQPLNAEARARKALLNRQTPRPKTKPKNRRIATYHPGALGYLPLTVLFGSICFLGVLAVVLLYLEPKTGAAATAKPSPSQAADMPTNTPTPLNAIPTNTPTPLPDVRMPPDEWRDWAVIPRISQRALNVYRAGGARGNDPRQFTILGDCHSMPDVMFARFDDPAFTLPSEHAELQAAREHFAGEFARQPVTVSNGMNEANLFAVMSNDPSRCNEGEAPLDCELRIHNPSIAIISLGTNWGTSGNERYEEYMRRILDCLLAEDILPVITTMADIEAGADFPLNRIMAKLAYEYDLPLWNFWRLAQSLPNHGLVADPQEMFHLTPEAWEARRYSGLAVLNAVVQATR